MNENDIETMLTAMLARLRVSADSVIESAEVAQIELGSDARGALSRHGGIGQLELRVADLQRWMDAIRTTCAAIQCQRAPLKVIDVTREAVKNFDVGRDWMKNL